MLAAGHEYSAWLQTSDLRPSFLAARRSGAWTSPCLCCCWPPLRPPTRCPWWPSPLWAWAWPCAPRHSRCAYIYIVNWQALVHCGHHATHTSMALHLSAIAAPDSQCADTDQRCHDMLSHCSGCSSMWWCPRWACWRWASMPCCWARPPPCASCWAWRASFRCACWRKSESEWPMIAQVHPCCACLGVPQLTVAAPLCSSAGLAGAG